MKARQAAWLHAGSCRALANVQPEGGRVLSGPRFLCPALPAA